MTSEGTKGLKSHAWGVGCKVTADDSSRKCALGPSLSGYCSSVPAFKRAPTTQAHQKGLAELPVVSGVVNFEESGLLSQKQDEGWRAGTLAEARSQQEEQAGFGA